MANKAQSDSDSYRGTSVKSWEGFIVVVTCNFPPPVKSASWGSNYVCLPDVVDPLESMLPPELSILRDSSPHPRPGAAARRSSLPFPLHLPASDGRPFSLPSFSDHPPWAGGEPDKHQGVLSVGLSVQCEDTRMVVSINKESLQVSGLHSRKSTDSWNQKHIVIQIPNNIKETVELFTTKNINLLVLVRRFRNV